MKTEQPRLPLFSHPSKPLCVCPQRWSHPRPVIQGAARKPLSQQSLKIGGPLNSEEQKFDLDLPGAGSHQLGQLGSDEQTKSRRAVVSGT